MARWHSCNILQAAPAANRYFALRMRIALAAARPADAVRAEVASERFVPGAAERRTQRSALLDALRNAREHGIVLESQPARSRRGAHP